MSTLQHAPAVVDALRYLRESIDEAEASGDSRLIMELDQAVGDVLLDREIRRRRCNPPAVRDSLDRSPEDRLGMISPQLARDLASGAWRTEL